jgi:AAA+ superfamily predicted ATPase
MKQEHDGNDVLDLMELLLTAEILNLNPSLDKNDLTPEAREILRVSGENLEIKRPVLITEGLIGTNTGTDHAYEKFKSNPFVKFEEFGKRLQITSLEPASDWFIRKGGAVRVERNPVLASYYEGTGTFDVAYNEVRANNPPYTDTKAYLDAKIAALLGADEEMRTARDLIIISAPSEIELSLDSFICTKQQKNMLEKIGIALTNRDFLRDRGIYEFGKLLFVGPPGTGKTSLAIAMSHELHMPVLEVRLAMVTSQYLGETSKNIDRIFEFARKLSPCILFIDEFDFVAKSRITDDNAAMKRAVNMLLKNIDQISFIRNGVLLVAATNHPWLLDEAAWRRFDDVVEFPLPDRSMRLEILKKVTLSLQCECDFEDLAGRTEGFSGADLRIMIKEALLHALMRGSQGVKSEDIEKGMNAVRQRDEIRQNAR